MSVTLTYGLENPETGDLGSSWFTDLNNNIVQLDAHTHNGTNSARLASSAMAATTSSAASGSWGAAITTGRYRQIITMPAGMLVDEYAVVAKTSTGYMIYPTIEKINSTTFYIYTNDNSLTFTIYYMA